MALIRTFRRIIRSGIFACIIVIAACSAEVPTTPTPRATAADPTFSGIVVVDQRLMAPMLTMAAHPEWAPGTITDLNAHRAVASLRELCVEVARPNELPLYVTIGVDGTPWTVDSIVIFDASKDEMPRVTYNRPGTDDPDVCRSVLAGSGEPFPSDPSAVGIVGGVRDPEHAVVIAQELIAAPDKFGIDRSSRPSLNLLPIESGDVSRVCYEAIVYQGGPRAKVVLTLRVDAAQWRLRGVRVVAQALSQEHPATSGLC